MRYYPSRVDRKMACDPLNLPVQLKTAAEQYATQQGISLNQFILWAVSEKVGELKQQLDDPAFPHVTYRRGASGRPMPALRGSGSGYRRSRLRPRNGVGIGRVSPPNTASASRKSVRRWPSMRRISRSLSQSKIWKKPMARPQLHLDASTSIKSLHQTLLARGHDVTRTPSAWMPLDAGDEDQLLGATAQGRCIFTFNVRDFLALASLHPPARRHHPGRPEQLESDRLDRRVDSLSTETDADVWPGQVRWLNQWRGR